MRANKSKRFMGKFLEKASARTMAAGITGLVLVCVAGVAMLRAAREPVKKSPEITTVEARSTDITPEPVPAAQAKQAPATITGCLERDDKAFRLKDTTGTDAPKSRSWKSAFLKKGSASVHVSDPANRLKLSSHIGERVSVTGTLVDREMQVRSLQRVAGSCE
jgi:hypothetical protein